MPPTLIERAEALTRQARDKRLEAKKLSDGAFADDGDEERFDALVAEADDLDTQSASLREKAKVQKANAAALAGYGQPQPRQVIEPQGLTPTLDGPARLASLDDPKRGYQSPLQFYMDVHTAYRRGQVSDQLKPLQADAGSDEQSGFSDPYGGFMLPVGFSPQVQTTPTPDDPLAGRTRSIPMETTKVGWPARVDKDHRTSVTGGLTVTRRAEAAAVAASRQKYEKIELSVDSLFGLAFATEEILVDSPISVASMLADGFRAEMGSHTLEERLTGTGVGEFLGVFKSPCLITVPKEGSQAAKTILYINLVKMLAQCWRWPNAIWLYNPECLPQLLTMKDDAGNLIWAHSARDGVPSSLMGLSAFPTEHCEKLGDKGDILLGNWGEYIEGTYQAPQSAESIHVRFVQHERCFKFWLRNAGAPWWTTTLIPKKGAAHQSPFVTLAAR